MAEKKDLYIFLVLWVFTVVFFILQTYTNLTLFAMTIAFAVIGGLSIVVLLNLKSDETFYRNLQPLGLVFAVLAALAMILVSSFFSSALGGASFTSMSVLTAAVAPSSIATNFLYDSLFTFAMVATGEEMLKLAGYSELKARKLKYVAIVAPVGLWAAYHAIQAYGNPWMIVPAFINGLLLIGLLEWTRNFLAPIIAHGIYNSSVILLGYLGSSSSNLPLLPTSLEITDLLLFALAALWIGLVLLPVLRRKESSGSRLLHV